MTERTIRIKGLISGQVDMGTFGLVELELLSIEKEMLLEFEKAQQAMDEREVLINAFDAIRKEFLGRWWLKEGRGNYPYDDERYKEEVRYIMDAFNEIESNVWKNIKSKSFEYRKSIEKPLLEKIERLELELKEIRCQK